MDKTKKISFVIPCYYSQDTIENVVGDINNYFPIENYNIEIVLVNDGSKDNTRQVLKSLSDNNANIVAANLARNFGQDGATLCGCALASGDYIVVLDDDGQNPPSEAIKLLDKIDEGYDAVFGKFAERKDRVFKKFGTKVNDCMVNAMLGKPKDIVLSSYFVISKFVRDEIIKYDGAYPYIWGLILRSTDNIANVIVEHKNREVGTSNYTFSKMISLWMNGFISFSVKPLRLTTIIGMLASVIGFLSVFVIIIKTIIYGDLEGWPSLMAVILIVGGIQMIMMGLLGEYIGRIFINNNRAPQYIIKDLYGKED